MARHHDVDVLTTCARDYITWANEYPEGADQVNGVTVRRFATASAPAISSRSTATPIGSFTTRTRATTRWPGSSSRARGARRFLTICPGTLTSYDALIFFTYLYAPTVLGLQIAPERSILAPTAHNEPAIGLGIYEEMFRKPAAIAFNTAIERAFLESKFAFRAVAAETVGCGVDLLEGQPRQPRSAPRGFPEEPFLLYGGRIDAGKGCAELIDFFSTYKDQGGMADLVLMGARLMPLPDFRGSAMPACCRKPTGCVHWRRRPSSWCLRHSKVFRCSRSKGWRSVHPCSATRVRTYWWTTAGAAMRGFSIRIVMNSRSARICCSPIDACARAWARMENRTSEPTITGTSSCRSTTN